MKKFLLGLVVLALIAMAFIALPLPRVNAQTAGQGKIEGLVVNQTKDAKPASGANLEIVLVTVPQGATSMLTTTVKSDANGKFAFGNLETISTTRYFLTTNYGTVDYFSDLLVFTSPQSTTLSTTLPIYETTADASVVRVAQVHLVMDVQTPWIGVQEIIAIENTSDRVYIGKQLAGPHRATLNLPILPKAIDIQFDITEVGDTTLLGDEVLTYTLPIGPGPDQIVFQYAVPFTPPNYDLNFKLPFATDKLGMYMTDYGQTITAPQLTIVPNPMASTPGAPKFLAFSGDKLAAGTTLTAKMTNLPAAAPQSGSGTTPAAPVIDNTQTIGLVVLGVAIVAAIALIALPFLRKRQAAQIVAAEMKEERVELLQDIADLDDEFEANKITEAEYKEQRAALKAKLLELDK